jgi:hypothetical protein
LRLVKIIVIWFGAFISINATDIIFQKEEVTLRVLHKDSLEVTGTYWFVNKSKQKVYLPIYFPFKIDEYSEYPSYIFLARSGETIPYKGEHERIKWEMEIAAESKDSVILVYRQHVRKQLGCYIVLTAKKWNRLLDRAEFKVSLPENCLLQYCSFNTDSIVVMDKMVNYFFIYEPFSPQQDLFVQWLWK